MLPFRDYNPSRTFPLVTVAIIAVNVLVYLYMISVEARGGAAINSFYQQYAVVPARLTDPLYASQAPSPAAWITLFTAMFMHGGPVHLLGNMLYLWIFGNNVEDAMGKGRFLVFYLLCGILATAAQILPEPRSPVAMLGASGAIAGVLGAYLVRFPRAQVDSCLFVFIFVTVIRLPAVIVLLFWFVLQLLNGTASFVADATSGGGVAYWAHIGGFLAGMMLIGLFARRSDAGGSHREPTAERW